MNFDSKEIKIFLWLCDYSFELKQISRGKYKERLLYLDELSKGRYLYQKDTLRRGVGKDSMEDVVRYTYDISDDKPFHNGNSDTFEVIKSADEDPNKFSLVTIKTGFFGKWKLAGISDPDPFPSIPHFHGVGNYSKFKLDPYTGKVYEGKKLVGKEKIDIIRGMWRHDGFRQVAKEAIKHFNNEQNLDVYNRYLERRGITRDQMDRLPKKRSSKGSEKMF
ncbi:hypothetical protein LIV42_12640 [Bacillus cereus]|uniref:hypothetical protein n=1 Tax=Bacillus cereus TaxID=1396 RepID=UPI001D095059|nr:hypothetical protein [Bacillus cereus]MCB5903110.1 hypothetical protein [Bacillus cereus]